MDEQLQEQKTSQYEIRKKTITETINPTIA